MMGGWANGWGWYSGAVFIDEGRTDRLNGRADVWV